MKKAFNSFWIYIRAHIILGLVGPGAMHGSIFLLYKEALKERLGISE